MTFSIFFNHVKQMLNEEIFEALVLTYCKCHWYVVRCDFDNTQKAYELISKSNDEYYSLIVNYTSVITPKSCLRKSNVMVATPTKENIVAITNYLYDLPIRQVPLCLRQLYAFLKENESMQKDSQYQTLLGKGFAERQINYLNHYELMQNEKEKKRYDLCAMAAVQALNSNNLVWSIEKWNKNHNLVTLINSESKDSLQLRFLYLSDASVWYYNASERIAREEDKEFNVGQFAERVLWFYRNQCELRTQEP